MTFVKRFQHYWPCPNCGRCYVKKSKGIELSEEGTRRMKDLEKSWLKQGTIHLCCRVNYDKWCITQKMNKK